MILALNDESYSPRIAAISLHTICGAWARPSVLPHPSKPRSFPSVMKAAGTTSLCPAGHISLSRRRPSQQPRACASDQPLCPPTGTLVSACVSRLLESNSLSVSAPLALPLSYCKQSYVAAAELPFRFQVMAHGTPVPHNGFRSVCWLARPSYSSGCECSSIIRFSPLADGSRK